MAKKIRVGYKCINCGKIYRKEVSICLDCGGTEIQEVVEKPESLSSFKNTYLNISEKKSAKLLKNVHQSKKNRLVTKSFSEFNRVMGGGIVEDSISIISAPPGTGKTTLLLEIANDIANQGLKVLYASGEESEDQLSLTSQRILKDGISDNFYVLNSSCLDDIIEVVQDMDIDFFVIDSINVLYLKDFSQSNPGSPTQMKQCFMAIKKIAKDSSKKRAVFIVGQVTKDDELSGPNSLAHDGDVVLELTTETDSSDIRFLRGNKNRFGQLETGMFLMSEYGMKNLSNPSEYFTTNRDEKDNVSGVALSVIIEGTRPIVVEIEALVSNTKGMYPTRITTCLKKDELNILLSVLEQKSGLTAIGTKDVVLNTTSGIKLKETGTNLAVIMSIYSSLINEPLPAEWVYLAEVGLTGELKSVASIDRRLLELDRMNYKVAIISDKAKITEDKLKNIKIIKCKNLISVIKEILNYSNK